MEQSSRRGPLTFPVTCDHCQRKVQAKFWPIIGGYNFSFEPIKAITYHADGKVLEWYLLCSDCLVKFDETLITKYPVAQRRYTITARDAKRLAEFLRQTPHVTIDHTKEL